MSRDDYDEDDRPRRRPREDDEPGIVRNRGSEPSIGMSVASMVLGIISVVIFCIWFISVPLAIMAIIFGSVGMNKGGKGMAIAGIVCGIAAIAILAIFVIIGLAVGPTWQPGPDMWKDWD